VQPRAMAPTRLGTAVTDEPANRAKQNIDLIRLYLSLFFKK
jgi:hypothetical protein